MLDRLRILLLEPNRYHALLFERTLAERFSTAIVARFATAASAIEELQRTVYDIAVVACDSSHGCDEGIFWRVRESNSDIIVVVIGSKNTHPAIITAAKSWADEFITRTDDTPTMLPDIIERYSRRWLGLSRHPMSEGLLDARTRSAIIRLTVSTLAHEINNPLMTVLGTTELLLDDAAKLPPEHVERIRMIQESARRIESTLTDLAATGTPQVRETPAGLMIDPKRSTG